MSLSNFDMSDFKRFALGAVLIVLFSATAVATGILLEVDEDIKVFKQGRSRSRSVEDLLADVPTGDPQTILLLGSDRRFADIGRGAGALGHDHRRPHRRRRATRWRSCRSRATSRSTSPATARARSTRRTTSAAPKLMIETVSELLGIDINHVVNVNFGGFRRAIDRLGCVYVDVDRRYFNDNTGPGPNYAMIDLKPGYQKLCGSDALDFVRFRHEDSDFVRAARQQAFLSQAKEQVGLGRIVSDRKELLADLRALHQTDIADSDTAEILGLLKLAYASSKSPVTEIQFPATDCKERTCVEIDPEELADTVMRFIDVRGDPTAEPTKRPPAQAPRRSTQLAPGLGFAQEAGREPRARDVAAPRAARPAGVLPEGDLRRRRGAGYSTNGSPRSYEIFDRDKKRHRAYRLVLYAGELGQYYGVQGTTWKDAPILDNPDRRADHRRPPVPALLRRQEDPAHRVGDAEGRVLGLQHAVAEAHEPPDDGDRPLAAAHLNPGGRASRAGPSPRAAENGVLAGAGPTT